MRNSATAFRVVARHRLTSQRGAMATDKQDTDTEPDAAGREAARAAPAKIQRVLVASLVGAIILMIAIAAFWTSL